MMSEHNESGQERAEAFDMERALNQVIEDYFQADAEFLYEHDVDERVGAVYGMLLEIGEDPDMILGDAGVLEGGKLETTDYQGESSANRLEEHLVQKPLEEMTIEERLAWYMEYMKTVDEDNVMMVSGMPIEVTDDPQAFADFVASYQPLKRQGGV